ALGIEWPDTVPYARLVATLVSRVPEHAAFLNEATTLFRGAGYVAFGMPGPDGGVVPPPENTRHAAIAADYAHVTAPLRRLVDRYATEICLAVVAGTPAPAWARSSTPSSWTSRRTRTAATRSAARSCCGTPPSGHGCRAPGCRSARRCGSG